MPCTDRKTAKPPGVTASTLRYYGKEKLPPFAKRPSGGVT